MYKDTLDSLEALYGPPPEDGYTDVQKLVAIMEVAEEKGKLDPLELKGYQDKLKPLIYQLRKDYASFYSHFYDKSDDTGRYGYPVDFITLIVESNIKSKSSVILEYGCATGFNLRYLKQMGYDNLHGFDSFKDFIEIAKHEKFGNVINYQCLDFSSYIKNSLFWEMNIKDNYKSKYDFNFTRATLQQPKASKLDHEKENDKFDLSSHYKNIFKTFSLILKQNGLLLISEGIVPKDLKSIASELSFVEILLDVDKVYNAYLFKKL